MLEAAHYCLQSSFYVFLLQLIFTMIGSGKQKPTGPPPPHPSVETPTKREKTQLKKCRDDKSQNLRSVKYFEQLSSPLSSKHWLLIRTDKTFYSKSVLSHLVTFLVVCCTSEQNRNRLRTETKESQIKSCKQSYTSCIGNKKPGFLFVKLLLSCGFTH